MPFTLAHPAAVLPLSWLLGRHTMLSALVIGSMMPDAPYFLALSIDRGDTHSLAGLLWFCLPLGLIAFLLFHSLLKLPLAFLLPPRLSDRLPLEGFPALGVQHLWTLPGSIWLGSLTHIVWDACTHKYGFFVDRIPLLTKLLFRFAGYNFWVYKVLQYVSGIVGLVILLMTAGLWFRRAPIRPHDGWVWPEGFRRPARLVLWVVPSMVGVVAGLMRSASLDFPMLLRHMVITSGRCFLLLLVLYALAWWISTRFFSARVS